MTLCCALIFYQMRDMLDCEVFFYWSIWAAAWLIGAAAPRARAARRDGISAIWSGSCGCFGSVSPPPLGMFAIDGILLLGVIFFRPIREANPPGRIGSVLAATAIGFGLAFSMPSPKITITPVQPSPADPTTTATPPAETGWGAMPTTLESFYVADFENWVGTPLASHALARLISRPLPDWIDSDRFHLILYREDCEHCHTLLEDFFFGPLDTKAMLEGWVTGPVPRAAWSTPRAPRRPWPSPCRAPTSWTAPPLALR